MKNVNVTNTHIQSKKISMVEQNLADNEENEVVSSRSQTLQDILSKSVHYNGYVRKDTMVGLKEIIVKFPKSIRANIGVVVEGLMPRLIDDESVVREAAFHAWEKLIAVVQKNEIQPFISLILVYCCNGMTHLKIDIRMDTLKAIQAIVASFPKLLVTFGGRHFAQLIVNFQDMLGAKSFEGIQFKNAYKTSSKSKSKSSNNTTTSTINASSTSLSVRMVALNTLILIFEAGCASSTSNTTTSTTHGNDPTTLAERSCAIEKCTTLLLYATPTLVFQDSWSKTKDGRKATSAGTCWKTNSLSLFEPLVELWLESCPSDLLNLTCEHFKYLIQIARACKSILVLNPGQDLRKDVNPHAEWIHKCTHQLLSIFPFAHVEGVNIRRDHIFELNLILSEFACAIPRVSEDTLESIASFCIDSLEHHGSSKTPVEPIFQLLQCLLCKLSSASSSVSSASVLEQFTDFYQDCVDLDMRRACNTFILWMVSKQWSNRASTEKPFPFPSTDVVQIWMLGLLQDLASSGFRDCTDLWIGLSQMTQHVLSQSKELGSEIEHPVVETLLAFFQHLLMPGHHDQNGLGAALALVYHLPTFPPSLLKGLAKCCRSVYLTFASRSFVMEMVMNCHERFDTSALLSFSLSILFGSTMASPTDESSHAEEMKTSRYICTQMRRFQHQKNYDLTSVTTPFILQQLQQQELPSIEIGHSVVILFQYLALEKDSHKNLLEHSGPFFALVLLKYAVITQDILKCLECHANVLLPEILHSLLTREASREVGQVLLHLLQIRELHADLYPHEVLIRNWINQIEKMTTTDAMAVIMNKLKTELNLMATPGDQ